MEGVVSVHGKGMEEVTVALGKNLGKQEKNLLVVPNSVLLPEISKLELSPPICPCLSVAYALLNCPMTALSKIFSAMTTTPNVAL